MSENRSTDIAEAALSTGAGGYVVKSDAASELLPAVLTVLQGKRFVSLSLTGPAFADHENEHIEPLRRQKLQYHEVKFYPDDPALVDDFAQFIEAALRIGNVVIVIASESLHTSILHRLSQLGVGLRAAAERNRSLLLDISDPQSTPALYEAVKAARREGLHVAVS